MTIIPHGWRIGPSSAANPVIEAFMAEQKAAFKDERLSVEIVSAENQIAVTLTDRETGEVWGPTPLLALEIHDKTVRREDRLTRYRIDAVEEVEGGVHVVVGAAYPYEVSMGLWLRLRGGELSVLLHPPEVYERRPAHYRLYAVEVLPRLMEVGPDGTLLMPLGTGTLCSPRHKPAMHERCMIYLEQERWELGTTLPFAAVKRPGGGLVAIASQGACDAQFRVATDGEGRGWLSFAFSLRRFWPDPVDLDNREFRWSPLAAASDPVTGVAERLRRHVMEDLGKPTLKERAAESPEIAYLLGAYTMKLFHGIENEGLEMQGHDKRRPISFFNLMTFKEAEAGLRRVKEAGIDRVLTQCTGWNPRGHDGLYPTRFPIDERLGGEAGFRALIAAGHAMGFQMNVHDNFIMNIPHAPNFDPEVLIHDMFGEPLVSGWWGGGIEYQTWGLALPPERLGGHLDRVKGLGLAGMYYCDYMMRPLEVNYHPRWRGPRSAHCRGQLRILQAAKERFGAVATEYGVTPAAVACDYISAGGGGRKGDPSWPIRKLMDKVVPIWDLVFSGLTLNEVTGLGWEHAMRRTLFGKHPRDEWTWRPARTPVLDDLRVAQLKAHYDLSIGRFGYLKTERIVAWDEPNDNVQRTRFSDGTEVIADFGKKELVVNGKPVNRPDCLT